MFKKIIIKLNSTAFYIIIRILNKTNDKNDIYNSYETVKLNLKLNKKTTKKNSYYDTIYLQKIF